MPIWDPEDWEQEREARRLQYRKNLREPGTEPVVQAIADFSSARSRERLERRECRRQRLTVSIDDLPDEPSVDPHEPELDIRDLLEHIARSIESGQQLALHSSLSRRHSSRLLQQIRECLKSVKWDMRSGSPVSEYKY